MEEKRVFPDQQSADGFAFSFPPSSCHVQSLSALILLQRYIEVNFE